MCDESQLPLRKLAVDSHLISLLQVDNCSVPHHTCLNSASMGELTKTPLIWVGVEGEHCPGNASLFSGFLGEKCLEQAVVFESQIAFQMPESG